MLSKKQVEEYGSMSFEDLCDMIDELKDKNDDLEYKVNELSEKNEKLESAIEELQSDLYNGRNL